MSLKRLTYTSVLLLCSVALQAQISVKVIVDSLPEQSGKQDLYIAGNFNNWNPQDDTYKLQRKPNGKWHTIIHLPGKNILEFKLTKGSWDTVEQTPDGDNRVFLIRRDTTIRCSVTSWNNAIITTSSEHTALAEVHLLDSAFYFKQLKRTKKIWICLPKDYATSDRRYPVLYMHDGQNLFDAFTNGLEWQVDESLNNYFDQTYNSCIIVGIEHGEMKRFTEYNPYDNERFGRGEGIEYVQDIVECVKPFIDNHYRTLKDTKNCWIAGSSLGGLISLWAVMAYPDVFGAAGIFSPSLWIAPEIKKDITRMMKKYSGKLFFYCGGLESMQMEPDIDRIIKKIKSVSNADITKKVAPRGRHNERNWSKAFPVFLQFLFNNQ